MSSSTLAATASSTPACVAIAGASGFVGKALAMALAEQHEVIALGRSTPTTSHPRITHRRCDLYNTEQAMTALEGATSAVYLVHSMLPSARLVQASFSDLDVICADNFARAAARAGIKHIVYLGGLIPETDVLSEHLRSREEVERVLASHGAEVTTLRAGMVIGPGGSSFRILLRLAQRLPWMVIPRWGACRAQPIGLEDVVRLLVFAVAHPELAGKAYDVGSPSVLAYSEMLKRTGRHLGRELRILTLPFDLPVVSLLWVSAITGASVDLVLPLIESLKHEMLATQGLALQQAAGFELASFDALVEATIREEAKAEKAPKPAQRTSTSLSPASNRVVSLQCFTKPRAMSARDVADAYFAWLPNALRPLIRVTPRATHGAALWLAIWPRPLLELTLDEAASDDTRTVYRISGGELASAQVADPGTLEFRSVLGGELVTALVSGFVPRLPWVVYKGTQAVVHLWVMRAFGRHLKRR